MKSNRRNFLKTSSTVLAALAACPAVLMPEAKPGGTLSIRMANGSIIEFKGDVIYTCAPIQAMRYKLENNRLG